MSRFSEEKLGQMLTTDFSTVLPGMQKTFLISARNCAIEWIGQMEKPDAETQSCS